MGIALGLSAAFWFGAASLLVRVGMRTSRDDDGLYMSIFVNVVLLGAVGVFVTRPPWSTAAIAALAAAGLVGVLGGRFSNLRAVRYVGATRASVFNTGTPVVAAAVGWVVLDESLGIVDGIGGALVIAGLLLLARSRSTAAPLPGSERHRRPVVAGYMYAAAAPALFGVAFVLRKWGLREFDSVVLGAFVGALVAFAFLTVTDVLTGSAKKRLSANFVDVNWWFVAAGVSISLALLSQFWAFSFVAAWVVGAMQGTQAMWVLVLGYAFFRSDERLDAVVAGSVALVAAGVVLISVAV